MSTTFSLQQVTALAMRSGAITPYESAAMLEWSKVNPETLTGRPDLLQQALYWQDRTAKLVESPMIQRAIHAAPAPTLSFQKHQPAQAMKATVNNAMGNHTLQQQTAPQQRSMAYGQPSQGVVAYDQSQMVKRGPQIQAPDLTGALVGVKRALDELPARFAALAQRSEARQQRQRGQVVWRGAGGSTLTRVESAQQQPQLPVSPFTGQPSQIRAAVLHTTGQPQQALNQHPYYQQQQAEYQAMQQRASYEASLPISPFTGQPSSIRAAILKTT